MSILKAPDPVKPIAAIFSASRESISSIAELLEEHMGPVDYVSRETIFDQTDYYHAEMGGPLFKRLFGFDLLIEPQALPAIKKRCAALETEWAVEGRRRINIDPGYVALDKLVLATGKPASHRIYLDQGVWADLTLTYQRGGFQPLPWTYPDFEAGELNLAAAEIRKRYLDQLKSNKGDSS